jgi:hypothetical protein
LPFSRPLTLPSSACSLFLPIFYSSLPTPFPLFNRYSVPIGVQVGLKFEYSAGRSLALGEA